MKLTEKFNKLTFSEYLRVIDRHEDYSNFNVLGLFRSILETDKLDLAQKLEVRDLAISKFERQFEFFQLKDPRTHMDIQSLGQPNLTVADRKQMWENLVANQKKILAAKQFGHRNFGVYSKHDCGYESCYYNGLMIKRGSFLTESLMRFDTDEHTCRKKIKVDRQRKAKRDFKDNISKLDFAE